MAGSDLETRFAYLLKPIRDLAKNWEIDIASQLEDYLDQIDQITITFDNGATSMNFAEAALVIQGSACIYSKKVEYLYSMVYQVLDLLASKKKLAQAGAPGEGGDDADGGQVRDQEEEFLTLDDIKEHNNIDMKDNGKSGVCDIPQTPMALSKLDETEKGDNPLISTNGEVLANRYDFKMNLGHMHQSAMMLLDMSHLSLLEASLFEKPSSTPFRPLPKSRLADDPPPNDPEKEDSGHVDEGLPADISMDDDAPPDLDLPPMSPPSPEQVNRRELRERKNHIIAAPPKAIVDPWKMMDPHDPLMTVADKPFRKAKTFKMPTTLESDATKKRKRKKDPNCGKLQPISEFSTKAYYSASSRFPTNPLKIPFPEFEPLYWKELQRRQQKLRSVRKQLAEQGRLQELAEVEQADHEDDDQGAGLGLPPADDDDEGDFQMPDIQMPDIPDMNFQDGDAPPFSGRSVLASAPVISSYEELVRQHVEGFMACAQQYAQVTDLSKRVAEWEQKIIPKLEEEDAHDPFDIHKYGSAVIEKIPETTRTKKETVPFREVVQGKPDFEVCRLFLATLQLANNYNVEISVTGELDQAVDTMALKFLSTKRHHEDLQEYRAPSLQH